MALSPAVGADNCGNVILRSCRVAESAGLHYCAQRRKPALKALRRILRVIVVAGPLCGCTGYSGEQTGTWSVRPESHCSSLTVSFPVDLETLKSIVGPNFEPTQPGEGGAGILRVTICDCRESMILGKTSPHAGFAVATVPLRTENAPIAIAGHPADDWSSLVLYVGSESERLSGFMRDYAIAAIAGESSLARAPMHEGRRITAQVAFAGGRMNLSAVFSCDERALRRNQILVGTGSERYSILFGELSGRQCGSSDVALDLVGDTPFSDLGLTSDGAAASWATGLTWNYRMLRHSGFPN